MSAEILREAAALMRSRAEAATPGPWRQEFYRDGELLPDGTGGMDNYETPGSGVYVIDESSPDGYCVTEFDAGRPQDAAHLASWHPAVALAVADWLEAVAQRIEDIYDALPFSARLTLGSLNVTAGDEALAVATAYLGRADR